MKVIKVTKKEEEALQYAAEFLLNSWLGHQQDSLGKTIRPQVKQLSRLVKKLSK